MKRMNLQRSPGILRLLMPALILIASSLMAQVVYEPLHRDVYDYLSRLSQKGVIEYHDIIKPLSRQYIAGKLTEISGQTDRLNSLEKQELAFFQQEFYHELNPATASEEIQYSYLGKDAAGRYRLFSYRSDLFDLNLSPIYGLVNGRNGGESEIARWNGAYLYGRLGKNIGFSFDFRDNLQKGKNLDIDKAFSPETGVDAEFFPERDAIEFSEVHTTLAYNWSWGNIAWGKDFLNWGQAESGQVVLSSKAPSFPFVRLDLQPAKWLHFNYFHGWLISNVVDSSQVFPSLIEGNNSFKNREKYLASHTVTITPKRGLDIALGESIVYSDQLEIAYLMPLMFFRLADHYLSSRQNSAGSNAQLFAAISSRNHIPNTHLHFTLFIDDLSIAKIFDDENHINHVAATVGASVTDFLLPNLTVSGEYTRVNPFVYKHFIPTELYTSSSYGMGHWMGHNSDLLYGKLNYRIRRGLQVSAWGQKVRKGEDGEVVDQYRWPHKPFLFGLNDRFNEWGGEVSYELTHELFLGAEFRRQTINREQAEGPALATGNNRFFFSLYYGR